MYSKWQWIKNPYEQEPHKCPHSSPQKYTELFQTSDGHKVRNSQCSELHEVYKWGSKNSVPLPSQSQTVV